MKAEEQLKLWVEGISIHNKKRGECCPDFSCCNKAIDTPIEVRKKFAKAYFEKDNKTLDELLTFFLSVAVAEYFKEKDVRMKIYITGDETNSQLEN